MRRQGCVPPTCSHLPFIQWPTVVDVGMRLFHPSSPTVVMSGLPLAPAGQIATRLLLACQHPQLKRREGYLLSEIGMIIFLPVYPSSWRDLANLHIIHY